jgi:hypothetical protein
MTLLDLQGLVLPEDAAPHWGGSRASLLLCGNSSLSITTCN